MSRIVTPVIYQSSLYSQIGKNKKLKSTHPTPKKCKPIKHMFCQIKALKLLRHASV